MSYPNHAPGTPNATTEVDDIEQESGDADRLAKSVNRDVVVPLGVYKAVTVFSTLIAILIIVTGFLVLDVATNRATADLTAVDPLTALVGLVTIGVGALVYAFSTRFRTDGMGPDGGENDG